MYTGSRPLLGQPEPSAEDREHLSALSIGHYILAGVALFSGIPALVWGVAGAKLIDEVGSDWSIAMGDISGQAGVDPFGGGADAMLEEGVPRHEIESAMTELLDEMEQQIAENEAFGGPPQGTA